MRTSLAASCASTEVSVEAPSAHADLGAQSRLLSGDGPFDFAQSADAERRYMRCGLLQRVCFGGTGSCPSVRA